jgi:hypothetical protein
MIGSSLPIAGMSPQKAGMAVSLVGSTAGGMDWRRGAPAF